MLAVTPHLVPQACQAVRSGLAQGQGGPQLSRSLFGITEVLLMAHAAAVTAAVGSGGGGAAAAGPEVGPGTGSVSVEGLLAEYREARARHVPLLLQDAVAEDAAADPAAADDPLLPQVRGGACVASAVHKLEQTVFGGEGVRAREGELWGVCQMK